MYKYTKENGAIIDPHSRILYLINGETGHVDFPEDLIWKLHKLSPGVIHAFAHTHPPEMPTLSKTDEEMLKGWCLALYPFPCRMSVITQPDVDNYLFAEKMFLGFVEKKKPVIVEEWKKEFYRYQNEEIPLYTRILADKSYVE